MSVLLGIGVGPGDYEQITLKALRLIKESDVIVIPVNSKGENVAYDITKKAYREIDKKTLLHFNVPMIKDRDELERQYSLIAKRVEEELDKNQQVAILTLGDPTVYSSCMYLLDKVKVDGYETQIVNGVTSFCDMAGRLGISLGSRNEQIHIIPASYSIEEAIRMPGTKVLMKAGSNMSEVRNILIEKDISAVLMENCGMDDERIYNSPEEFPENASYYSTIIIK